MTKNQVTIDGNIEKVIALCNEMIKLADIGDDNHRDDTSRVFYGALRDSAYKIRRLAKSELVRYESGNQQSS